MKRGPTIFLQIVVVILGFVSGVLLLWEPHIEGVNAHARFFEVYFDPFIALVYVGAVPFFVALRQTFKLLRYVRQNKIFSLEAVKAMHTIKYCALTIIGFVVVEEVIIMLNHGNDDPAGGVFIGLLITLGSIVVVAAAIMFEGILKNSLGVSPSIPNEIVSQTISPRQNL